MLIRAFLKEIIYNPTKTLNSLKNKAYFCTTIVQATPAMKPIDNIIQNTYYNDY